MEQCTSKPELVGKRVVGEINCPCAEPESYEDPILQRNHAPGRTVLGIINKDVRACLLASYMRNVCKIISLSHATSGVSN